MIPFSLTIVFIVSGCARNREPVTVTGEAWKGAVSASAVVPVDTLSEWYQEELLKASGVHNPVNDPGCEEVVVRYRVSNLSQSDLRIAFIEEMWFPVGGTGAIVRKVVMDTAKSVVTPGNSATYITGTDRYTQFLLNHSPEHRLAFTVTLQAATRGVIGRFTGTLPLTSELPRLEGTPQQGAISVAFQELGTSANR